MIKRDLFVAPIKIRERLPEKCDATTPEIKIIRDVVDTLFLTTVAVEPTFVAFL